MPDWPTGTARSGPALPRRLSAVQFPRAVWPQARFHPIGSSHHYSASHGAGQLRARTNVATHDFDGRVLINDLSTTVLNGQRKHTDKLQAWNQNLTLDGRIVVVEKTIGGSLLTPLAEASGLCEPDVT